MFAAARWGFGKSLPRLAPARLCLTTTATATSATTPAPAAAADGEPAKPRRGHEYTPIGSDTPFPRRMLRGPFRGGALPRYARSQRDHARGAARRAALVARGDKVLNRKLKNGSYYVAFKDPCAEPVVRVRKEKEKKKKKKEKKTRKSFACVNTIFRC
jgi:hypothetical protein